jgi:glutamine synthetase
VYELAKRVRLLFTDLVGVLRGAEVPYIGDKDVYTAFFDASSVFGFEEIENSDLQLRLPRERIKTLLWNNRWYAGISSIHYPSGERYIKDPRLIAEKTSEYMKQQGYTARLGVEMELFFFKDIHVDIKLHRQELVIEAPEIQSGSGLIPPRKGYYLVEPVDEVTHLRERIIESMEKIGFRIAKSHHEVATAGQVEITGGPYNILDACDFVPWFKYVARYIAKENGYIAVFLPKPLPGDNGSGMHVHVSLWSNGRNLFYDPDDEYHLSGTARYFIGGLIEHGRSLSALISPTVNSYRRLIPGYEAPTILA